MPESVWLTRPPTAGEAAAEAALRGAVREAAFIGTYWVEQIVRDEIKKLAVPLYWKET